MSEQQNIALRRVKEGHPGAQLVCDGLRHFYAVEVEAVKHVHRKVPRTAPAVIKPSKPKVLTVQGNGAQWTPVVTNDNAPVYGEKLPWETEGVQVKDCYAIKEVLDKAKVNWTVAEVPVTITIKGELVDTHKVANVRLPDKRVVGVVDADDPEGQFMQHEDLFAFTQELVESGYYRYERCGQTEDGLTVFVVLSAFEEVTVGRRKCQLYMVAANGVSGERPFNATFPVVVDLKAGAIVSGGLAGMSIRNYEEADAVKRTANAYAVMTEAALKDLKSRARAMAEKEFTREEALGVLQKGLVAYQALEAKVKGDPRIKDGVNGYELYVVGCEYAGKWSTYPAKQQVTDLTRGQSPLTLLAEAVLAE